MNILHYKIYYFKYFSKAHFCTPTLCRILHQTVRCQKCPKCSKQSVLSLIEQSIIGIMS